MRTAQGNLASISPRSSSHLSVVALRQRERNRLIAIILALAGVSGLAILLLLLLPSSLAIGVVAIILAPAVLMWLWQQPVRGVYVLLASAVLLETQYPATVYVDDLGRYVPFFEDLATWTHIKGLSFSLAECFMLLVVLIWLLKGIAERSLRFERGSLMLPVGLYMTMVLVGEAHGLGAGGDFRLSLWEVRSQVYMFVAYVLACNLVTSRKEVERLAWILVLGTAVKGMQGTFRYLITLHGNLQGIEALFPHEQSYFYNAYLVAVPILFLYGGSRRLKRFALLMLPFVVVASLANQRRAAIVALGVAAICLLVITAVAYPRRRRAVAIIVLALAVLLPPYYLYYSNKSGLTAEPARAIASAFTPDARDASSNLYRINEDKDIMATMRTSPIIGYGFGRTMLTPYPLADISGSYIFWNLLPHDSILWVWMRLGTIGYLLLWLMIGTAIVQAARGMRRLQDPYLKGLAVLIILMVIQEIIFGYLDLQWTNYRNLIVLGVLFALIGRLAALAQAEQSPATPSTLPSESETGAPSVTLTSWL